MRSTVIKLVTGLHKIIRNEGEPYFTKVSRKPCKQSEDRQGRDKVREVNGQETLVRKEPEEKGDTQMPALILQTS